MNTLGNHTKRLISGACLALVLVLLTPTFYSLLITLSPDTTVDLVAENPLEEEREEERSSAEDEIKELKECTLPGEHLGKYSFLAKEILSHQYSLNLYSSELPVPTLPPELLG